MGMVTFACYIIVLILIGVVAYRRSDKSNRDFLNSSRDHGTWMTALSASASSESGWVTLGLVGAGYSSGISCFWLLPGCAVGYLFNWIVLAPRIYDLANQRPVLSVPELLETCFLESSAIMRTLIRMVSALLIVLFLAFYVAAQFIAGGKALEAMFGWSYHIGVVITAVVVLSYTVGGGLRAISWTDVLQAVLMFCALIIVPTLAIGKVYFGGDNGVIGSVGSNELAFDWFHGNSGFAALGFVIGWLGIGLAYPGQPHVIKRFLAARSNKAIKQGRWIALVWSQVVFAGAIILGIAGRNLYQDVSDPEQILPIVANGMLPPVFAGLVIAAVFSAICSTADSQLLESSTAISYDLIPILKRPWPLKKKLFNHGNVNRIFVLIIGVIAFYTAILSSKVIFWFVLYAWAALGASLGTALSMALIWKRCSPIGVLMGLITGPIVVVLWKSVLGWNSFIYELVPAFLISLLSIVLGSVLFPRKKNNAG